MPKEDVHIALVLDQSSSMGGVVKPTIESVNQLVADQAAQPGVARLTLTLFSTTATEKRFDGRPLAAVPPMTAAAGPNCYAPHGGTPLYDAVGNTIRGLESWLATETWFDGRVMVVILTDGEENSSREWRIDALNTLIAEKSKAGWDFMFLGSGKASWTEAKQFTAIPMTNVANFAGDGLSTRGVYGAVSNTITRSRAGGQSVSNYFVEESAAFRVDLPDVSTDTSDTPETADSTP